MQIIVEKFGEIESQVINSFTIKNAHNVEFTCINYGCIITRMITPDKTGKLENVVLGYDTLEEYMEDTAYLGAVVGPVGGRIKNASFELDEQIYTLAKNEGENHIHGGLKGFNRVIWEAEIVETEESAGVRFRYVSVDGEEGYPGNVSLTVTYLLNNENELSIKYEAKTDKKTLLTMTNHSYFNLSGDLKTDILDHTLTLKSEKFLELDDALIPTGNLLPTQNTPFDFTKERSIQSGVQSTHPQNKLVGGYDHPFLLNRHHDKEIVLRDPESGRKLLMETDEVGVVVYSGNAIQEEGLMRGVPLRKHLGICLETQGLPNAIHYPSFPSIILDEGEKYRSVTKYKFIAE